MGHATAKLLAVLLADRPLVMELADVEPTINGVTLGPDRAVYYTDQKGGHVYRVTPDGTKTQVTRSPIEDANGLAFGPDRNLYVLTFAKAKVTASSWPAPGRRRAPPSPR